MIGDLRVCARPECGAQFRAKKGGDWQRYCSRSCAAYINNAHRAADRMAYEAKRTSAIGTATNAIRHAAELRPPEMPSWAYDYIEHIGRVPTARYLDTLYAGRRYDD